MNYQEIIEKTYEVVDAIKESEEFEVFLKSLAIVEKNPELTMILSEYHRLQEEFERAYKYKDYYPDFVKVKQDFQDIKLKLMNNELFKEYKLHEKKIESYLNVIEDRLKELVAIKEKHGNIRLK